MEKLETTQLFQDQKSLIKNVSIGTIILCAQEVPQIVILNRTKINN